MTVKEKMSEVLEEDFDTKNACPNGFAVLQGHFYRNTKIDGCDGDCERCWSQVYSEEDVVYEIKKLAEKAYDTINSYDDAVAVRTALETVLKQMQAEPLIVGEVYHSVNDVKYIIERIEEDVLFVRNYYTGETCIFDKDVFYSDFTLVSKEEK